MAKSVFPVTDFGVLLLSSTVPEILMLAEGKSVGSATKMNYPADVFSS